MSDGSYVGIDVSKARLDMAMRPPVKPLPDSKRESYRRYWRAGVRLWGC